MNNNTFENLVTIIKNKNRKKRKRNTINQSNNLACILGSEDILNENKYKKTKNEVKKIKYKIITQTPLIVINANNIGEHEPLKSNYILNIYDYDEAIIYEDRNIFRLFLIYLISKDNILNIIFINTPLELKPLRIYFYYNKFFVINFFSKFNTIK